MNGKRRDPAAAAPQSELFDRAPVPPPAPRQRRPSSMVPGESPESALPIDDLAQLIRQMVQGSFPPMWVRGEVTQFTKHRNGHWYFTLKGRQSTLRCVMWATATMRVPAAPDEGMTVCALGTLDVFTGRTDLQFSVRVLDAQGDGLWRKAFNEIRGRLAADGLLDESRRRPLPFHPRCVAVITSPDGAALHDILSVVRRRNPLVEVVLIPAVVQGDGAPKSLRIALERLVRWGGADVVIIGRGGGSREDLWCFNDERLARKVAACPIPIISAVGHEIDVTICDLVADFRAQTPSAAAERAVPLLTDVRREVRHLGRRLAEAAQGRVRERRKALIQMSRRGSLAASGLIDRRRLRVQGLAGKLHVLSPLATLGRGYTLITNAEEHVVTSATALKTGDTISIRFRDGRAGAEVTGVEPQPPREA